MSAHGRPSPSTSAWVSGLCGCICVVVVTAGATCAAAQEAKTLERVHDPVIVSTGILMGLPTHSTRGYRLYSAHEDILSPIPFQFDERDDMGEIVFSEAAAQSEFRFDENDELVFMAKDTGDRIATELLPATSDAAVEIEVTDPVTRARGWAYLLHFAGHIPLSSPVTYARFDSDANQARTLLYTVDNYPGRNFFTGLRIAPATGGTDENILERIQVRVHPTFSLFLSTWSPLFTDEDFSVRIDGVKNGPVRAIRRVRQSLNLGRFFPEMPDGTVLTYYYASSFTISSVFSAPWVVLKALQDFQFTGVSEFRGSASEMTYRDTVNPQGLAFSVQRNRAEAVTDKDHDWFVVGGKQGTYLQAFMIPEQWREWGIVRGTVFRAQPPAAGYSLLNMTNLRKPGNYHMNMIFVILTRPYRTGDEVQPLAIGRHPLHIACEYHSKSCRGKTNRIGA